MLQPFVRRGRLHGAVSMSRDRALLAGVACFGLLLGATDALAQARSPAVVPPSPAAVGSRWYGWQTLIVAVPSLTVMAVGRYENSEIAFAGLGAFVLGGPIVHGAHGHWDKAGGSLGLNLGLPLVFGVILPKDCTRDGDAPRNSSTCKLDTKAVVPPGVLVGAAIATGIDAAFLAREDAPREGATVSRIRALPHAEPLPGGAWIGARGVF